MRDWGHLVVDASLVRRVLKRQWRLSGLAVHVPHDFGCAASREEVLALLTDEELRASGASGELPPGLVLVADDPRLTARERWRRVAHGALHLGLEERRREGSLSEATVRARVQRLGQGEFDEIRQVLRQEDRTGRTDDTHVYIEFAALYLELRAFEPAMLPRMFPSLRDHDAVEALLAQDIEAAPRIEQARPEGEPPLERRPVPVDIDEAEPANLPVPPPRPAGPGERTALQGRARLARDQGNLVRAAIATARSDPGQETPLVEAVARRLLAALGEPDEGRLADWTELLGALVTTAASRSALAAGREARLLLDLQRACADHEEVKRGIDLLGWLGSLGKRPLVRELPAARAVNVVRHLRSAERRVTRARIAPPLRRRLERRLGEALHEADHRLREELGPRVRASLEAVGLRATGAPERVALRKLVDELLDQASTRGYVTISHLRDSVARGQLKMADLGGPGEWWRGDALLAADRELARQLDGVYRPGEAYLRGLQKVSSVFFGTPAGRALTLHLLLPAVVSFVVLEGLQHLVGPLARRVFHARIHLLRPGSFAALAVTLYALIHSAGARRAARALGGAAAGALRAVFVELPGWVLGLRPVRAVLDSAAALVLWRYLLKPALAVAPLYLLLRSRLGALDDLVACAVAFAALTVALNTPPGQRVQERAATAAVRSWRYVSGQLLPGLLGLIMESFQRLLDGVDRVLYAVDERLRFRRGDAGAAVAFKAVAGTAWGLVTYLVRLFVNVLFEPQVNPIKHFPVVTVSHKLFLPMTPSLASALHAIGMAPAKATSLALTVIAAVPGAVGFLVWELKSNWDLYARNRPPTLRPVLVGHHGETMGALLRPGFHSGTVPKLYARMRDAVRRGHASASRYRQQLREVEHAVARFVERELSALLAESEAWTLGPVAVAAVEASSNRIRVELGCERVAGETLCVHFEEQSGWVVAGLGQRGWLDRLDPGAHRVLEAALAGLYRLAGVDMCREQLEAHLTERSPYDVSDEGLVVWPGADFRSEVVYRLRDEGQLVPELRGAPLAAPPPPADGDRVLLRRQPLGWADWLAFWRDPAGAGGALARPGVLPRAPGESLAARAEVP